MKKIILRTFSFGVVLIGLVLIGGITGCEKDTTLVIPLAPPVVNKTVSFNKDIVPLLTKNCALSGCHISGGHKPDLSVEKAYNSLIDGKYVDKTAPEKSIIYERLICKLSPAMPMGASPNPSNIDGLMLAWIKQGAKKN